MVAVLAVVGFTGMTAFAGDAAAHAELIWADPQPGSRLVEPPTTATLRFTQPVRLVADGIRLLDAAGTPLALDRPRQRDTVVVDLPRPLADGGYVLAWRVISADSHPVSGAIRSGWATPRRPPIGAKLSLVSGTATNGVWRAALNVPSTWNGRWQVSTVAAYDTVYNLLQVDPRTEGIAPVLTVVGTHRPALSFGLVPAIVYGNGPITMRGRAYYTDTGAGIPGLRLSTGVDNLCAEGFPANDIVTNASGYYGKTFPSATPILFCVRLVGPTAPGQCPTIIAARSGAAWIKYVVTAAAERTPVRVGTSVAVNGQVLPLAAGLPVFLQRLVGGTWRTVHTATVRQSGRYTLVATPPTAGNTGTGSTRWATASTWAACRRRS